MIAGLARTRDEAILWLDLHPCERCGGVDVAWASALVQLDGEPLRSWSGTCPGCGEEREVLFRLPPPGSVPPGGDGVWFGPGTSELLDPGEWLWVADQSAGNVPVDDPAEARRALDLAAAAVDEVLRFVPDGAELVPDAAFRSDRGRQVRDAEPGRFDRERLEIVRDTYRRRLAELGEAVRVAPAPAGGPPLARTHDEAQLWLDLHPCGRCGSTEVDWEGALAPVPGGLGRAYSGTCGGCGVEREHVFRVPERPPAPPPGATVFFGGPEPSELLDPGEWLWVADLAATNAPAEPAGARPALAIAAAAVAEILKFVPAAGGAVPAAAFRSARGRRVYAEEPGRFDSGRLTAVLASYHRRLSDLEGRT